MRRVGLIVLVVGISALTVRAGIIVRSTTIGALAIDGNDYGTGWNINAPLVARDGSYLAYRPAGKAPEVYFTKERGPHAQWAVLPRRKIQEQARDGERGAEVWGRTLHLRVPEGPFESWYLGRAGGKLTLVPTAAEAATLAYRDRRVVVRGRWRGPNTTVQGGSSNVLCEGRVP